jgi:hypothetical protein
MQKFTQLALVATIALGLQACGDKKDKSHTNEAPAADEKVVDHCPKGVDAMWYTTDEKPTGFAVVEVDGVIRFTLGGYLEQIYVNGETQVLTPTKKGKEDNKVEVSAYCQDQVIYMSQKDEDGNVRLSEWRLNAEEASGSLTVKNEEGETKQVIPLRKNLVAENHYP